MGRNKIYLIITIVLFISRSALLAQETDFTDNSKHRIGFITGYGDHNNGYNYEVQLYQLQYYKMFLGRRTWSMDFLLQPQYNRTKFKYVDGISTETNGYELGVNLGIIIRKNIFKDYVSIYTLVSLGPHYISGAPQRQSKGFVFSDNIFVGLNIKLSKNVYLDLRSGFRHLSNAGLTDSNAGLNNFIFSAGVLIPI